MSMTLEQFINSKKVELSEKYNKVELHSNRSVMLKFSSVSEAFLSSDVDLDILGKGVTLFELEESSSVLFKENGTKIIFNVVPKGKRKPIKVTYYFLWDEVN